MSRDLPGALVQWLQQLAPELPAPEREYRFHPVRRWRLDLAWTGEIVRRESTSADGCSDMKYWLDIVPLVAVECHGGTYSGGRHTRGKGFENDREKMNEAQLAGFIVLEFTSQQIDDDPEYCVDQIRRALEAKAWQG